MCRGGLVVGGVAGPILLGHFCGPKIFSLGRPHGYPPRAATYRALLRGLSRIQGGESRGGLRVISLGCWTREVPPSGTVRRRPCSRSRAVVIGEVFPEVCCSRRLRPHRGGLARRSFEEVFPFGSRGFARGGLARRGPRVFAQGGLSRRSPVRFPRFCPRRSFKAVSRSVPDFSPEAVLRGGPPGFA